MKNLSPVITVFGSAYPREGEPEYERARKIGLLLAQEGFTVCNGGYGGTMEASARGAHEGGGHALGVVAREFGKRTPNQWLDEIVTVDSFVERLLKLVELGQGYVVLKGGTGTMLELATVWEFLNKQLMREKPILVFGDFWKPVVERLNEELAWEGRASATGFVTLASSAEECVQILRHRFPPQTPTSGDLS